MQGGCKLTRETATMKQQSFLPLLTLFPWELKNDRALSSREKEAVQIMSHQARLTSSISLLKVHETCRNRACRPCPHLAVPPHKLSCKRIIIEIVQRIRLDTILLVKTTSSQRKRRIAQHSRSSHLLSRATNRRRPMMKVLSRSPSRAPTAQANKKRPTTHSRLKLPALRAQKTR